MVYLSANGEVIGQFEERDLPSSLAAGKVPPDSFFWREGMPEWRPLRELVLPPRPQPAPPSPVPDIPSSSPTVELAGPTASPEPQATPVPKPIKPAIAQKTPFVTRTPTAEPSVPAKPAARAVRKIVLAQAKAATAPAVSAPSGEKEVVTPVVPADAPSPAGKRTPLPLARKEVAPASPTERFAVDSPSLLAGQQTVASSAPAPAPEVMLAAVKTRGRRGRKGLLFAAVLLLLGALGAVAWWFFPKQPPALAGQVRLAAADGTASPVAGAGVFLVSREELAAHWRDRLAEAQSRAAEVDELFKQATAVHREKTLVLELATRTSELGDEYNMPDAAELRAARDAAQAEEATALAEVEKLKREKASLTSSASLLQAPAEALDQTRTDDSGAFRLALPGSTDGLVVLVLAEAGEEENPHTHGWLVPLGNEEERKAPVLLSSDNALDAEQIKELAGAQP
jgi:hypothetical protein